MHSLVKLRETFLFGTTNCAVRMITADKRCQELDVMHEKLCKRQPKRD